MNYKLLKIRKKDDGILENWGIIINFATADRNAEARLRDEAGGRQT